MAIDLERLRADTPGCAQVLHFDSAGASLMPQPVVDAQIDHLRLESRIGGYGARREAAERIEAVYGAIARLLNCSADEVSLQENATLAWNMAFHAFDFRPGDRILTAEAEYASNYIAFLRLKKRVGLEIEVVPNDDSGALDPAALEAMLDDRVKLIAVTHVPTNGGLVNPAAEIGRIAKAAGVPFLLDACQSAGQLELDVEAIGCDLLSATGRKFLRGPRGSGFLYVRRSLLDRIEPPFLDLHGAEWVAPGRYEMVPGARRFENWEFNYAAVLGLGAAVDYALAVGMAEIEGRVRHLAALLRDELRGLPGVTVHDLGRAPCGLVTFTCAGREASAVEAALRAESINVSVSELASTRLDTDRRQLPELVRASPHYFNSEDEIARFVAAVRDL